MKIPERLKFCLRVCIYDIFKPLYSKERDEAFRRCKSRGIKNIPIFIISFNRLSYVKGMIEQLENRGFKNINIIDNKSTYPPLLEYYKTIPYKIYYLNYNGGHKVFWKDNRFSKFRKDFYVVTDPDLEIISDCPNDFLDTFFERLWKYPFVMKVGFSLKIDDLPLDGCLAKEALEWEEQYYKTYIEKDNIYYAGIDTTFALYQPERFTKHLKFLSAFRMGYPYQTKHLPWYKNENEITDEDKFYSENKSNGWWDNVKGCTPD